MKKASMYYVFLAICSILFFSCTKEDPKPDLTASFDVTYKSDFQSAIYPSMIFGLTEIEKQQNEPMDYFTIKVKPNIETDLKITIQESKLNFETIITENNVTTEKTIIPSLKWKYDDLKNLTQPGNVDLTFIVTGDENKEIGRKTIKLGYRSINECVIAAKIDNEVLPLYGLVAGYVNEYSPVIDGFLQQVLQKYPSLTFDSYQSGDSAVVNQVRSCFYTLRSKGVKYSNIAATTGPNPNIVSQYIRFSDEVLNNTQANCADGTAFFCSVLKKIGIHTCMVFIPGHVYLGYYLDNAKTKLWLLETTAVGVTSFTFNMASEHQINNFNANLNKFNNADYFDGYFVIDIDNARKLIKPIGR